MNPTLKNDKKPNFGSDFGSFGPNLGPQFFAVGFTSTSKLDIVSSYHPMQCKGKLMNQTWENNKKHNFGPDFGLFSPNSDPKIFLAGFISASS